VLIVWLKLLTPLPNALKRDKDAPFGKKFFDFSKAQTEPMVQPDSVTENFRKKAMTVVAEFVGRHAVSLPQVD